MRFHGKSYKDGKHWLVEAPVFDAMTQGRSRDEALAMIKDWFVAMLDEPDLSLRVDRAGRAEFEVAADDACPMISLLLRRQRQKSGLSLTQAAERLGAKSRNAYARYEQGRAVPTVAKLDQLLRAVAPDRDIVVRQSDAA